MIFTEITPAEFTKFASKSPYKSFMQTEEIAKLREQNGWVTYYFGVKENDQIKAASMLVAKPTFLGKSTFIAPGGPLLDYEDTKMVNFFFKNLRNFIKTHNGYVLQISPYYEVTERDRNGTLVENGFNHKKAIQNLQKLGFIKESHPSQPEYMFAMEIASRTPDEILADFKRNTRNHVRKAERAGVKIRELTREELPLFKQITESTSERRHFADRPLSYYEQMYDLFHEKGEVKFLVAELENAFSVGGSEPGKARISADTPVATGVSDAPRDESISSSTALILSAAMFMLYGDEIVYLFSGSDEKYMKEYNAQYLIQWYIIKYAAEHGFKRYNFYGISGLPKDGDLDGIYEFKKGFDTKFGKVLEYLGTYELAISPALFHLHRVLSGIKH